MSLGEKLGTFLSQLNHREKTIFEKRILSAAKLSLEQIGVEIGLTRERVRQIEKGLFKRINSSNLLQVMTDEIRTQLFSLDKKSYALKEKDASKIIITNLGFDGFGLNISDIAQFTETYEVDGGFLHFPTKQDVVEDLEDMYSSLASASAALVADFESTRLKLRFCARLTPEEFLELLTSLGWTRHSVYAYPPTMKSFEQKFHAYLLTQGKPIKASEALRAHFSEFSERSSINRIRTSDLFTILDGGLVKIREDGDSHAKTISELVDEAMGSEEFVTLDDLTKFILARRDAAKSSIRSYASTFPFQLKAGLVSRATAPKPPQAQIAKTKRLYRIEKGWRLRLSLNEEIMRGSSVQLPTSIVGALDLPGDAKKKFWSDQLDETFWVSWQGMQPKIQAVRKAALALGGGVNDHMLIDFVVPENQVLFQIVKFPIKENGLNGVAILLGLENEKNPGPAISKLIMSVANGGLSVIETLQLRKEYDAIEVYEGVY